MFKRIAVLTSGGDAPGMNAAIRAVVRAGTDAGMEMFGVRHGYEGLLQNHMRPLGPRDVGGIIQLGGTVLGSARSEEFKTEAGKQKALEMLRQLNIEALIVIGGNGSQTGAAMLDAMGMPTVGIASTIDNDLYGSEIALGVDTALNIAIEAIDRLKVTASSHQRAFLVETMGRNCGYLALMSGIAGGAETIVIPEIEIEPADVAKTILNAHHRGKTHALVVVAEGARHNAIALQTHFESNRDALGFSIRVTTLGHVQRGGTPSARDRILAARFGVGAIDALTQGVSGVLIGLHSNQILRTPLEEVRTKKKTLDLELFRMANILAT